MPASSETSTSTTSDPAPAGGATRQAAGCSKLTLPSALVKVCQDAAGGVGAAADGGAVGTDADVATVGDDGVVSDGDAAGAETESVEPAVVAESAAPRFPATATPPANAAATRATAPTAQGQRRRAPVRFDGSSL